MVKRIFSIITLLSIFCVFLQAQDYISYDDVAENAVDYDKKTVVFQYKFKGLRPNVSRLLHNRGVTDRDYVQLYTRSDQLTLLAKQNNSAHKFLQKVNNREMVLLSGKVGHWTAGWGQKFYYVEITTAQEFVLQSRATSENNNDNDNSDNSESRNRDNRNAVDEAEAEGGETANDRKLTLKKIVKEPQKYMGRVVKFEILFKGEKEIRIRKWKSYKRLKTTEKITLLYPKNDKTMEAILKGAALLTPLKITGKLQKLKVGSRTVYWIKISRIIAQQQEVNVRNRRNRPNRPNRPNPPRPPRRP